LRRGGVHFEAVLFGESSPWGVCSAYFVNMHDFAMTEKERQRCFMPLTVSSSSGVFGSFFRTLSRVVQRRIHRRFKADTIYADLAASLDVLYCGTAVPCKNSKTTVGQSACLQQLLKAAQDLGPPPVGLNGQGAFLELLARQGYGVKSMTLAPTEVRPPLDKARA
jgi:hypothetical protein